MANLKKEIDSLKAKIARLESEQKKAELVEKALSATAGQIDKILKDNGITFETYIRHNYRKISRIIHKMDGQSTETSAKSKSAEKKKQVRKGPRKSKTTTTIKIPAGKYGNLPDNPDQIIEVKEKGPRPKALKRYAEEVGLEAFLSQCRLD